MALLVMTMGRLYAQELSEEQYAILNVELIDGLIYDRTNFAFYWHEYLMEEYLTKNSSSYNDHAPCAMEFMEELLKNKTLIKLKDGLKNNSYEYKLSPKQVISDQVEFVSEYGLREVKQVSVPIIVGNIALSVVKEGGGWSETINLYKKSLEGNWEKVCFTYIIIEISD
jgi:hypothetical protein